MQACVRFDIIDLFVLTTRVGLLRKSPISQRKTNRVPDMAVELSDKSSPKEWDHVPQPQPTSGRERNTSSPSVIESSPVEQAGIARSVFDVVNNLPSQGPTFDRAHSFRSANTADTEGSDSDDPPLRADDVGSDRTLKSPTETPCHLHYSPVQCFFERKIVGSLEVITIELPVFELCNPSDRRAAPSSSNITAGTTLDRIAAHGGRCRARISR